LKQLAAVRDNLQEEMLRIILKRFIITCTRIAREKCGVTPEQEKAFDIVRRFYILVDQHFREKKQVQDYADLLFRSPKPLTDNPAPATNAVNACGTRDFQMIFCQIMDSSVFPHKMFQTERKGI
jgi:hypothetical protein